MEYTLREEVIEQLQLILESINIIQERNKEIVTVSDYTSSTWGMTVLDATLMRIQFIGETASSIDKKTHKTLFENYPHNPWKQIYSMRNYISHQYADIDPEMILVTIHKHLPPLQHTVKQIITDLKSTIA